MQREFFCADCGLFHWVEYFTTDEDGMKHRVHHSKCPNEDCKHDDEWPNLYPVDSTGWAYYANSNMDAIKSIAWTSEKYSPKEFIDTYKQQGVLIKAQEVI